MENLSLSERKKIEEATRTVDVDNTMLYRPQTSDLFLTVDDESLKLHKLIQNKVACDAIVVLDKYVDELLSKGWFRHADEMTKPEPKPKEPVKK